MNGTTSKLPESLAVEVNGAILSLPAAISKKGNVWYQAKQEGTLTDPSKASEVLASITASFEGETLKAGEVHTSPVGTRWGKPSGGNLTVTHSKSITLGSGDNEQKYLLSVTATVLVRNRGGRSIPVVLVSTKAFPQVSGGFKAIGDVEGELVF